MIDDWKKIEQVAIPHPKPAGSMELQVLVS